MKYWGSRVIGHQNGPEQSHGGDAVHIVVPVDAHGFPRVHGPEDAFHGGAHFPHQERIAQVGEPGFQKQFRFRASLESALEQELLDQQGKCRGECFQGRIVLLHGGAQSPMKAGCHVNILTLRPTGSRLFPNVSAGTAAECTRQGWPFECALHSPRPFRGRVPGRFYEAWKRHPATPGLFLTIPVRPPAGAVMPVRSRAAGISGRPCGRRIKPPIF